ncbi:MAG: C39 family peptidase [Ruminococcus sp.]|nr:C39 family peptidase [Ruminococcus sp.]
MKRTYIALTAAALLLAGCGNETPEMRKKTGSDQSGDADVSAAEGNSLSVGTAANNSSAAVGADTTVGAGNTAPASGNINNTNEPSGGNEPHDAAAVIAEQNTPYDPIQNTPTDHVQNTSPDPGQNTQHDPGQPSVQTSAVREEPSQPAAATEPAVTNIPPEEPITHSPAEEPPAASTDSKQIAVSNILQHPELPAGCETTSLTMLLNFYGIGADKLDIARNYLPKQAFYWQDGIMYGADFRTTFAGDPEDENSYGCYAPCIVTAANSYLSACGSGMRARDISGENLDTLLSQYIDNNTPVLIWITYGSLHEPSYTTVWTTPAGEQVQWYGWEHCAVLTGYDRDRRIIYVSDPIAGNTYYDMDLLNTRYEQFGRQCVGLF